MPPGDLSELQKQIVSVFPDEKNNGALPGAAKRAPLTIRTIDEILAMTFDDADLVLENGYATAGDLTTVCGPGGIGKTRLTMQFALCCRAGRDFLDWETNGRELRFLFLQTENCCRRLKADLEKMLRAFKPEEQEHIKAGIFFHTLEADDDGFLVLDPENQGRVEEAIARTKADVIVCDPLRDFSLEDLNSDKFMGETLRDILRVTKRGDPKRLPLVVHHAATGKVGAQKTTGWDRASFGRNSKVLQMMARAVINVGQAQADDNSVIIIGSGKCNNAPEFKAFAARLSFETMFYARDDSFDMEKWKEEVTRTGSRKRTFDPKIVAQIDWPRKELEKKPLARLIMNEVDCSQSRAYTLIDDALEWRHVRFNKTTRTYSKKHSKK